MSGTPSTHLVELETDRVRKRFRSRDRGEPEREWQALVLLAEYAPDLAPRPFAADLAGSAPTVTMSRLSGAPLTDRSLGAVGPDRLAALVSAVDQLHRAVPSTALAKLPEAPTPAGLADKVRRDTEARRSSAMAASNANPVVWKAFESGSSWLASRTHRDVLAADVPPVFGQGDGNLANFLWDGTRIRLVDFEDSGRSDRAYELAEIVEHLSAGAGGLLDGAAFIGSFGLSAAEVVRLTELRRLCAYCWLLMLVPGGPAYVRNLPETLPTQAERLLALLDG